MSFGQILKKTPKNYKTNNNAVIEERCRKIKQKQYFSSRDNRNELSSLSKLKNKLISPLKTKK